MSAEDPRAREIIAEAARQPDEAPLAIGAAAVALGALARPGVGIARYLRHLDELGEAVTRRLGAEAVDAAEAGAADAAAGTLARVMAEDYGYHGDRDTYDDLQNANLIRVVDRRRGLPVALGILYIEAARRQGWQAAGLNMPGHFVIRLEIAGERVILDPFNGGRRLAAADLRRFVQEFTGRTRLDPAHWQTVSDRDVLLRLQNNIVLRRLREHDMEGAARTIEAMIAIAPARASLWREMGLVQARMEHIGNAIAALEKFLELSENDASQHEVARMLQTLKGQLN